MWKIPKWRGSCHFGKITGQHSRPQFLLPPLGSLTSWRTWRHLMVKSGNIKSGGKQWQATPKNLPRMQRTRAIPVAWLNSGLCPDRPKGWIPIIINILFIITIGGILVIFIYITRLALNEICSPSNKIHREVGRAKDLSAPLYIRQTRHVSQRTMLCPLTEKGNTGGFSFKIWRDFVLRAWNYWINHFKHAQVNYWWWQLWPDYCWTVRRRVRR